MLTSAGCNVLDYLIEKPAGIVAADLNEAQLALLDLKLASLAALDHAAFFALWARSDAAVFEASYGHHSGHLGSSRAISGHLGSSRAASRSLGPSRVTSGSLL